MAKDPAFLFYSDNFQSGTQFFSDEQIGKYIRLLCAQHLHGHLSEKHMIHICRTHDPELWSKFKKDEAGNYYNERLEIEILKRRSYSESRSSNRKSIIKNPKNISKSYVKHMGNGIGIETGIKNEKRKLEFLTDQNWKSQFCMAKSLQMPQLEKLQKEFITDTDLKGEYVDSYKRYFTNWFNKQRKNGTTHRTTTGNKPIPEIQPAGSFGKL